MVINRTIIAAFSVAVIINSGACSAQEKSSGAETIPQASNMNDSSFLPGLIYSERFADILGLDRVTATTTKEPLLGAALDITRNVSGGHVCHLHVFFRDDIDARLPEEKRMRSISAHVSQLPYALIKKPGRELRQQLGDQVSQLANRAIVRFGSGNLTSEVIASEDKQGSYVSLPLNDYDKALFAGVAWLSMPVNCALAADSSYDTVTVFLESSSSPADMILYQKIDPTNMISIDIPLVLFTGMADELNSALSQDSSANKGQRSDRVKIIGG